MLTLLVTVALATGFALFSTQNTHEVQVYLGNYVLNLPFYITIIAPLLIGLLSAYFFHILYRLSYRLTISEQKDEIKRLKGENAELAKDLHKAELAITKLRSKKGKPIDEDSI